MSDNKKTIRVPTDEFEEARERKEANDQTWAEYLTDENRGGVDVDDLKAVTATPEDLTALREDVERSVELFDPREDSSIAQMKEQLEQIESSAETVEERTGRIERTLDTLTSQR